MTPHREPVVVRHSAGLHLPKRLIRKWMLCVFIALISTFSVVGQKDYHFQHLTTEDGLASNWTMAVFEDSEGFLWVNSGWQIYRYDGYEFRPMANANDSEKFFVIRAGISQDRHGNIWLPAIGRGLCKMNPRTHELKEYTPGLELHGVKIDQWDNFWITAWKGLYLFDPDRETFSRFQLFEGDTAQVHVVMHVKEMTDEGRSILWVISRHEIFSIPVNSRLDDSVSYDIGLIENHTNLFQLTPGEELLGLQTVGMREVWVGTNLGLYCLDLSKLEVKSYPFPFSHPIIGQYLIFDHSGTLWIGGVGGVITFDPHTGDFTKIKNDQANPHSIADDEVFDIFKDSRGNLWFATKDGGISRLDRHDYGIQHFTQMDLPSVSSETEVFQVIKDRDGNIWAGTSSSGLYKIDEEGTVTNYRHRPGDTTSMMSDAVTCLMEDSFGKIWIGLAFEGFSVLDPKKGTFRHYPYSQEEVFWYGVMLFKEGDNGRVYSHWPFRQMEFDDPENPNRQIVDFLDFVDLFGEEHTGYLLDQDPGPFSHVFDMEVDKYENLWLADMQGLIIINPTSGEWLMIPEDSTASTSATQPMCNSVLKDRDGNFWIGTFHGISKVLFEGDPLSNPVTFKSYAEKEGVSGKRVTLIGEDSDGHLWLISSTGLLEFDKKKESFTHYDIRWKYDYRESANQYSGYHADDGEILVGCTKGFLRFYPDSIRPNPSIPPVVITNLKTGNDVVHINDTLGASTILVHDIAYTDAITLDWDQNDIAFEFAALDFTYPEQNQYAYRLEGLQDEWVSSGTRNEAFFTNLDHGKYTFEVKGSNNDGIWSEDFASLEITIRPPPWLTWWAYTGYALAALGLLVFARQQIISRERLKGQAKLEHMELEKAREVDTLKTQFFSNISHEFRTPLTLILGPLERIRTMVSSREVKEGLDVMHRNGQRLQRLINQLLDLSRLDSGRIELQPSEQELVTFLKGIWAHFEQAGKDRSIGYSMTTDCEHYWTRFDRDKLEKAIFNLLSNAFKFSQEGGTIILDLKTDPDEGVKIRVLDTGRGIPQEQLTHIFDRFYQADATLDRKHEGSGIGLALARQFVELHDGTITVESKEGQGSTFTIELPLEELSEAPAENELLHGVLVDSPTSFSTIGSKQHNLESLTATSDDRPLVLVIEDNPDMRQYLWNVLNDTYNVLEGVDGLHGRKLAFKEIPDLIVSDIMMPGLDGQELCQQLKQDERTSHIPIVLLTARAGEKAKLEGLETGADDYITKPFSPEELKARVKNLIALRQKLREKYSGQFAFDTEEEDLSSVDQAFLRKVVDEIEAHRSDSAFNPDILANAIGLSRSQLHRKLKALIDMPTMDFVKCYRLKYAKRLLEKGAGNVVEVGYQCGFNSPSYFTTSFKKLFGAPPSEFIHSTQQ